MTKRTLSTAVGKANELLKELTGAPASKGRSMLLKHLQGDRLTRDQAIIAKCCDCMAYYVDGRDDCGVECCPLYPFRPYKEKI